MNEVIQNMIKRRSCRAYKDEFLKEEELDLILTAGTWAPTGQGTQAVIMVAVKDPKIRNKLSKMNAKVLGSDADPFYGAPIVVAVLADTKRSTYIQDGSVALENMMLAASSLGVGSCWIHRAKEVFESEEGEALKEDWKIPKSYAGVGHVILGYPAFAPNEGKPRNEGRVIKIN